jgi:1-acyl-sn-glycerol-3-phosphate acyltransferase
MPVNAGIARKGILYTAQVKPMSTARLLIRYAAALLLVILLYPAAIAAGIIRRRAGWSVIVRCNRMILGILGIRVKVESEEQPVEILSGGVIVGLNQESVLDPVIGTVASPVFFKSIFNLEYALVPLIGWVSWLFGWVIIRQWPAQARRVLHYAVSYIRGGGHVYLSIEGKRSRDGSLGEYKKGPVVMAIEAGTWIIPILILGSRQCLSYGEWKIRPGVVTVRLLRALPARGLSYEDRDALVARLRALAEEELSGGYRAASPPRV